MDSGDVYRLQRIDEKHNQVQIFVVEDEFFDGWPQSQYFVHIDRYEVKKSLDQD